MWGRLNELNELNKLLLKETSSLVVVKGRRRIGKSTLIQFFGDQNKRYFLEFSGLAPRFKQSNQDQINQFTFQFNQQFRLKKEPFKDWNEAFAELAKRINKKQKTIILFDEISWMGAHDPDFSGKLKIAWDSNFKKNKNLVLVLCGSVSTWIQKNILNSTNFVGRVSKDITLNELPLNVVTKFWKKWDSKVSDYEKLRLLAVVGCIPKYLEEINPAISTDENIKSLCFDSSGFLYDEFNKIFSDIFGKKTKTYKKIVAHLVDGNLSAAELAKKLNLQLSSSFLEYLADLELSGFISRDYKFDIGNKKSRISTFRIKDNFLRFSLKYIEDAKQRAKILSSDFSTLEMLPNWSSIVGFQIENLVYNHVAEVLKAMGVLPHKVISASPYFQVKTAHNHGACQIDLLVQTTDQNVYICEIKFRRRIDAKVIKEVEKKIEKLTKKRNWTYRPVLIYEGEIDPDDLYKFNSYFSKMISIGSLFRQEL